MVIFEIPHEHGNLTIPQYVFLYDDIQLKIYKFERFATAQIFFRSRNITCRKSSNGTCLNANPQIKVQAIVKTLMIQLNFIYNACNNAHIVHLTLCFVLHLIYCFVVCNVMYPVMFCFTVVHKQHLLNVNHLTSDKLINSGIIPSTKHPTNIARDMRITPQAPSMLASVIQPFRSNLLTHIQAVNTLKYKRKARYPL